MKAKDIEVGGLYSSPRYGVVRITKIETPEMAERLRQNRSSRFWGESVAGVFHGEIALRAREFKFCASQQED